jgi:hypothetical protein
MEAQPRRSGRPRKRPRLEEAEMEENRDEEMKLATKEDKKKAEAERGDNEADKDALKEVYIPPSIECVAHPTLRRHQLRAKLLP